MCTTVGEEEKKTENTWERKQGVKMRGDFNEQMLRIDKLADEGLYQVDHEDLWVSID